MSTEPENTASDEAVWVRTWLEEILHVHFHEGMEWETVDRWLADPKSFDIFGEPFRSLPVRREEPNP